MLHTDVKEDEGEVQHTARAVQCSDIIISVQLFIYLFIASQTVHDYFYLSHCVYRWRFFVLFLDNGCCYC